MMKHLYIFEKGSSRINVYMGMISEAEMRVHNEEKSRMNPFLLK